MKLTGCVEYAKNIVSLGTAGFIMQVTNSLVSICCNNVLSVTGGDVYISVMTIVSSVRQMVETPIYAINEGSSPILSYNYGANRPGRVRKGGSCNGLPDSWIYCDYVDFDYCCTTFSHSDFQF